MTIEEEKNIDNNEGVCEVYTSWWFQPIWKILVKLDHFP